ncbi:MAG: PEGA domain-containing protein [Planctomycetota bacterium]
MRKRPKVQKSKNPNYGMGNIAVLLALAWACGAASGGCVRRTISITTDPPNARVFLNDQEIGRSAVTTDFLWYGDYDVIIRKEGCKTLQTNWNIKSPWYQWIPFDFFVEVLWPGWIHDARAQHYVLEAAEQASAEEVIKRAENAREQALSLQK